MATKSAPLSIRLSPLAEGLVIEEARRTRRSRSAVVEALTEEAAKVRLFPGLAFRGNDWDRRPWVIGTSLDVWEIVGASREFESPQAMARKSNLTLDQIKLALAYSRRFPGEIDDALRLADRPIDELLEQYPTISELRHAEA